MHWTHHKKREQIICEFSPMIGIKKPCHSAWNISDSCESHWQRTANPKQLLRNVVLLPHRLAAETTHLRPLEQTGWATGPYIPDSIFRAIQDVHQKAGLAAGNASALICSSRLTCVRISRSTFKLLIRISSKFGKSAKLIVLSSTGFNN